MYKVPIKEALDEACECVYDSTVQEMFNGDYEAAFESLSVNFIADTRCSEESPLVMKVIKSAQKDFFETGKYKEKYEVV